MNRWILWVLWCAVGCAAVSGPARAVLPEAPARPKPSAAAASAAAAREAAREAAAREAAQDAKRQTMERCLTDLADLRRTLADRCVMADGACYDKAACEAQADGRYRCSSVNKELTDRHVRAMATPCR